ncbi:hypothetical protein B0H65DRAFT_143754 [Neurospora tetraspora]|uniref:Uncharacterized protein n=1 Tax=Neurospora tetraspora TaxID=94610 RepID=A0AAE0JMI8_9PEZI|nr:hypothetical protein B0H65DRAFT_143754 [Neurospora tetraspora]
MSKRKSDDYVENMAQGDCSAFVDIRPPCLPGTTTIEKLPIELLERIFEFVGEIAYVSGRDRVDFPDDETPCPFIPRDRHLEVPRRTEPTPYDYLRSSSLASRAFTAPAQRALFRVSMTRSSIGMLRLLRSLLEYPANRKYVQWLVASPLPRENLIGRQNPPDILDPISASVQTLGPLLHTPALDQLRNACFFRSLLLPFVSRSPESVSSDTAASERQITSTDTSRPSHYIVGDHILRAILELCPQIRGARLFYRNTWIHWGSRPLTPKAFPYLTDGLLGQDCFRLKSLTLDVGALSYSLLQLRQCVPGYPSGCPPTVEYLKIVGNDDAGFEIPLDDLYEWLSTNTKLRELRMLQRCDWYPGAGPKKHNWNTILPMFKDTLELIVIDGNRYFEGTHYVGARFGPSGMLDCLPQLKRLAYLKVPLHYLRDDMPEFQPPNNDWEDLGLVVLPDGSAMNMDEYMTELLQVDDEQEDDEQVSDEQENNEPDNRPSWHSELLGIRIHGPGDDHNILGLIQAELPPSLRKLDVVVVEPSMEEDEGYAWRTIEFSF